MPKTVLFHENGSADVLKFAQLPLQAPGAGEVRLRVEAIGLNRAEVMFREGQYLEQAQFPSRLGYEAAGVVDALGPDVDGFEIGERVSTIPGFSMGRYGVYAESAIVPAHLVARYPEHLSPVEGTTIWMQYLTAYGALIDIGHLQSTDIVLITAASSSVGIAALQMSKAVGAKVIATTRGADKKEFLLQAGADHVIVTEQEDLASRVMALSDGHGADLIFDPVAGVLLEALAAAAAPAATLFEYGALGTGLTPFPLFPALAKGLSVRGYTLFEIVQNPARLERGKQYIYAGLESGVLQPVIDRTFPFEAMVDAHRYMESNQQRGKIVVTLPTTASA